MYEIIKNVIEARGYKLTEIQHKVKKLYVMGDLTEEQMDELLKMAAEGVSADAERPEVMKMLQSLDARISALEAAQSPEDGGNADGPEAWEPWDGIGDKYQKGAVVAHNGSTWESTYAGQNVWEPGTVGTESLWKKVG